MLIYSSTEGSRLYGGVRGAALTEDRFVAGRSDKLRLVLDDLDDVNPACSDLALDGTRKLNVGTFCMIQRLLS
jgi:hypothetical protein